MDQPVKYNYPDHYPDDAALALPHAARWHARPRYSIWRFLLGFVAMVALAAAVWPALPRLYASVETLVFRPTGVAGQGEPGMAARQPLDESSLLSELDILSSDELIDRVIAQHRLNADPEFAGRRGPQTEAELRRAVHEHFVFNRDRRSYTFQVGFRSEAPAKAAAVARTIVSVLQEMQVARKRAALENSGAFLAERERVLRERVETARKRVLDFRIETGLIDQGARTSLEAQLATLSGEAANARARSIEASTRAQMLARMQDEGSLDSAPEVLSSPTIQQLNQSLSAAYARPTVFPTEIKAIEDQIDAARARVLKSAQAEAANWTRRQTLIENELGAIRQRLVQLNKAQYQLDSMVQEAANAEAAFLDALTRLQAVATTEGLLPDVEVISPAAVPDRPVFPSPVLFAVGALVLGVLAGAALNLRPLLRDVSRLVSG